MARVRSIACNIPVTTYTSHVLHPSHPTLNHKLNANKNAPGTWMIIVMILKLFILFSFHVKYICGMYWIADNVPAIVPRRSAQVCVRAWFGPSVATVAMDVRPTTKSERRVSVPTMTASRRGGGAESLVKLAVELERSSCGWVGKNVRKRSTLLLAYS